MKNVSVLAVILLAGVIAGCDEAPSALRSESKTVSQPKINLSVAVTAGNHTYIPLNISGLQSEYVSAFEKAHPELQVTSWYFAAQYRSYITNRLVYGLWITHEPRTQ